MNLNTQHIRDRKWELFNNHLPRLITQECRSIIIRDLHEPICLFSIPDWGKTMHHNILKQNCFNLIANEIDMTMRWGIIDGQ